MTKNEILNNANEWDYLNKGEDSKVYWFSLESSYKKLKIGEYALKVYDYEIFDEDVEYLIKLSNLKLIPKIYYINTELIIMDYIDGKDLEECVNDLSIKEKREIYYELEEILKKWHKKGYYHADLMNPKNVMIDNKLKVHLIDPNLENKKFYKSFELLEMDNEGLKLISYLLFS